MTCPLCHSRHIFIDDHAATDVPTYVRGKIVPRRRPAVVAFCRDCEWSHEIDVKFLR